MKKVLAVLLVLVVLLVVADRVGVVVAEHVVADQVQEKAGLTAPPDVDIGGVPFLTQVVRGRYDDVRLQLTAEELGQPAGTTADVTLHGVHVPLSALLHRSVTEIPVDSLDGTATLSYPLLSAQLGGDTSLSWTDGALRVTRTVQVLGFSVPLTADGSVTLDGTDLVVNVSGASAAGVDLPSYVVSAATKLLDLRYPVPELPFGLQLTGVTAAADGVHVAVGATDTVLGG